MCSLTIPGVPVRTLALIVSISFLLFGCSSVGTGAADKPLTLATWNMGWLSDRAAEISTGLRNPLHQRTPAEFQRLGDYAKRLGADVVAIEEVDGEAVASRVFGPDYTIVLTDESDYQRPGFAIRKGIRFTRNPDLAALDILAGHEPRSLRRGADVTLHLPGGDLRLLAVHLKSGCFQPGSKSEACPQLARQIPILSAWIDARQAEGVPFVVLGDFNRRFPAGDPLWAALDNGPTPLLRVSEGHRSACWGGQYPDHIDHIILGNGAARTLVPGSYRELVYDETDRALQDSLSDHCPSAVQLRPGAQVAAQ